MYNKIVYSANGVLTDQTAALRDYYANSFSMTVNPATDALYIGSKFPFTRKFLKVLTGSANSVASSVQVSYWYGNGWANATDTVDETATAGATLARSGYLSFTPDKRYPWKREDTTVDGQEKITGLGTMTLYDMYWVRIKFSGAVSGSLAWVGDVFCTDADLGSEHPDLLRSNVMTAYKAGKTDWEEQRMVASEVIIGDMKRFGVSSSGETLLSVDQLRRPAVAKTAELVFAGLGKGYEDSVKATRTEYVKRTDPAMFDTDNNLSGMVDPEELGLKIVRLYR